MAHVHVASEHVVVHVYGATVVYGIAEPLQHHLLTAVWGDAQLEEAGLAGRQAIHSL